MFSLHFAFRSSRVQRRLVDTSGVPWCEIWSRGRQKAEDGSRRVIYCSTLVDAVYPFYTLHDSRTYKDGSRLLNDALGAYY